jgi:phage terminase large subunit-like protein
MKITKEMKNSVPFQYAYGVENGNILCGQKIKKAVKRFFGWIKSADEDGFYLDHDSGMHILEFFPTFLNHTSGKLQGKPFYLAPFQQFTWYNILAWKNKKTGKRRISTVYDKRAKKNGKTAEMAGASHYFSSFLGKYSIQTYVGATKEDQAKICFEQAVDFIDHPLANPFMKQIGFIVRQKAIINTNTKSVMRPLGGDSKTQDGIRSFFSIVDEYHAHVDDSVKENLESSSVMYESPLLYHITTAGVNLSSVCKNYEDSVIEVLEGRKKDDALWVMIHDLDEGDDWEDQKNWYKANPLMETGVLDIENLIKEYTKAKNQPSKVPNFKTKHLNMWVDAPSIWIPTEIWQKNYIEKVPTQPFQEFGSYAAIDLSSTTDITADAFVSEPNKEGKRYIKWYLYCPEDTIERRSKEDRVPYRYWRDEGYIISTPGNVCDYRVIEQNHIKYSNELNVIRTELDKWNATSTATNLMQAGLEVSYFSQAISNMTFPTKQFEKMVYDGTLIYEYNPVIEWMLSGCVAKPDPNENIKIRKDLAAKLKKRVDGIIASIMALGGSLSMKEEPSKYSINQDDIYV